MKKDIVIYFLGKLLPMLVNLAFVILGVRYLGRAEYGKFSLLYSSLFIFFMLFFGWIQQSILRFNTDEKFSKNKSEFFFSVSFWISVLLLIVMLNVSLFYFKTSILISVLVGLCAFVFTQLFYFLALFQSTINSKFYAITESVFYLLWFLSSSVLVYLSFKNYWVGFVSLFFSLLTVVVFLYFKNKKSIKLISINKLLNEHSTELKKILSYGLPLAMWLFLSSAFNFADRFIIEQNFGFADAGLYSTVYDLFFKIATFVCMPFLLSNHSRIVNEWNAKNYASSFSIIKISILIEIVLMFFTIVIVYFLGDWAFNFLTKINMNNCMMIALPIVAASFIWQIGMFVHKPLELLLKPWLLVLAVIISLILNVSLNIVFIPKYKFEAAALSTLISTLCYVISVVTIIYYKKYHKPLKVENNLSQ